MNPDPYLRPDDSRAALLRAAIAEFAARGEAGARTDAIARAAGVNKALLHYYFGTKQALYAAVLDAILAGLKEHYLGILAPVSGKVGVLAAREGEVVNVGGPIATITDLSQTWVYAGIPETQADALQVGDPLKVRMPSGAEVEGRVIVKSAEGDFATQRDVSRIKRDIKTVRLKLLIPNPGERYVPGMTAEVLVPRAKLVRP